MADEKRKEAGQSSRAYQLQANKTQGGEGRNFINAEAAELRNEGLAESSKSQSIRLEQKVSLTKKLWRKLNFSPIAMVIGLTITLNFCCVSWSSLINAEQAPKTNDKSRVNRPQKERKTIPDQRWFTCLSNRGRKSRQLSCSRRSISRFSPRRFRRSDHLHNPSTFFLYSLHPENSSARIGCPQSAR